MQNTKQKLFIKQVKAQRQITLKHSKKKPQENIPHFTDGVKAYILYRDTAD